MLGEFSCPSGPKGGLTNEQTARENHVTVQAHHPGIGNVSAARVSAASALLDQGWARSSPRASYGPYSGAVGDEKSQIQALDLPTGRPVRMVASDSLTPDLARSGGSLMRDAAVCLALAMLDPRRNGGVPPL